MPDFSRLPASVFTHCTVKQANPLLKLVRGPAVKSVSLALQKALGGLKTYGKRLTGDSTLKPLYAKRDLLQDMEKNLTDFADIAKLERGAGTPRGDILDLFPSYAKWEQKGFNPQAPEVLDIIKGNARNYQRNRILDPKDGFLSNIYRQSGKQTKNINNELEAIRKTRLYTGGAASGTALGGIGTAAYNNSKQSAALPEPTSRGTTKKVELPSSTKQEPYVNSEGVMMNNKRAFMGIGALAGMAPAPNKEEEDLSIGRGALRGVGTGLGVGTGAVTGGLAGTLGGAGLGAILGALARGAGNRYQSPGLGASQLAPLGMLAGGLGGAIYGGYKGNKATKALLDKTVPISEKKKKEKDDSGDEEVRKSAAIVLAQLQKNAAEILPKV